MDCRANSFPDILKDERFSVRIMDNNENGLLSLFKGEIKGYVVNPYTGAVMSRRDVLDLYRYLAVKHINNPTDEWSCEMLLQTRDILGVPIDLHDELIKELKKAGHTEPPNSYKRPILEEIETLRFFRKGFCPGGPERHMEGEIEEYFGLAFISDILEMEQGSLLFEMENDGISLGEDSTLTSSYMVGRGSGVMDDMLFPQGKVPKKR